METKRNLCLDERIEEDVDVNPYQSPLGMSEDVEDCDLEDFQGLTPAQTLVVSIVIVMTEHYFHPLQRLSEYILY